MKIYFSYLDSNHHVQVTLTVLLDDITNVVRLPRLLKLSSRYEILYFPNGADSVSVSFCQPEIKPSRPSSMGTA